MRPGPVKSVTAKAVTAWSADATAIVEPGSRVGAGTRIWHHAHVRAGATIGENASLGKNVYIDLDVTIGSRVRIQNNVSVYRGVTIADDVFLGPSCVFTNARYPRADNAQFTIVPTSVQRGASVGANSTIVCGVTLGECSVRVFPRRDRVQHAVAGGRDRHATDAFDAHEIISRDRAPGLRREQRGGEQRQSEDASTNGGAVNGHGYAPGEGRSEYALRSARGPVC